MINLELSTAKPIFLGYPQRLWCPPHFVGWVEPCETQPTQLDVDHGYRYVGNGQATDRHESDIILTGGPEFKKVEHSSISSPGHRDTRILAFSLILYNALLDITNCSCYTCTSRNFYNLLNVQA
ncbi:MAG: hypothetical protein KAU38_13165, partial [Desulfobacterales bacterium]|nr:hypothetical protein [Desulfobacterales bacterium]